MRLVNLRWSKRVVKRGPRVVKGWSKGGQTGSKGGQRVADVAVVEQRSKTVVKIVIKNSGQNSGQKVVKQWSKVV